jgi:hypothetical protein
MQLADKCLIFAKARRAETATRMEHEIPPKYICSLQDESNYSFEHYFVQIPNKL